MCIAHTSSSSSTRNYFCCDTYEYFQNNTKTTQQNKRRVIQDNRCESEMNYIGQSTCLTCVHIYLFIYYILLNIKNFLTYKSCLTHIKVITHLGTRNRFLHIICSIIGVKWLNHRFYLLSKNMRLKKCSFIRKMTGFWAF